MADAQKKYNQANMVSFSVWLNRRYDADLIDFLTAIKNRNGFFKESLYKNAGVSRANRTED